MREPPGPLWGRAASCCLWRRWCSGCRMCFLGRAAVWPALTGRAAVCAGGRRPAREIATREPDGSEWSISRPALALPPPTGTAARPRRPRGGLQSVGVLCVARPGLPHRRVLVSLTPELTTNFACNSPATISNSEFTALKSQRFKALLNLHPIELHATFEEGQAPRSLRCPPHRWRWGFCSTRGWLSACRRRVGSLMTPFPPFGGGEAAYVQVIGPTCAGCVHRNRNRRGHDGSQASRRSQYAEGDDGGRTPNGPASRCVW